MREELLHFIWRWRHFNQQELVTEAGESLQIVFPGEAHRDQGPDFRDARIRIGGVLREGPVELHVRTSDWLRHAHDGDVHYRDVILHVVWENDLPRPPSGIPVLVLQPRVSKLLLSRYIHWMQNPFFVPCERQLPATTPEGRTDWLRLMTEQRLRRKAAMVTGWLAQNGQDWEETTWWGMARSMGLPVNGAVFEALARSLPLRLLARHRDQPGVLEALLLGQAGLLAGEEAREYHFWQRKYGLQRVTLPVSFLRMRPGHFPGARLVQLARLVAGGRRWFSVVRDADSAGEVLPFLEGIPGLGAEMRHGIAINAFVPLLFAYGRHEKALRWLEELPAERNRLVRGWAKLGVEARNAADSQGLLEGKERYCNARRCLDCPIGRALLKDPIRPA